MVKLAINIISGCYAPAKDWTLGQLNDPFQDIDKVGLAFALNTKSMVLPIDDLVRAFHKAGYGPKSTEKWLNCYNDMGFIKWSFTSAKNRYVCFLECPIDSQQLQAIAKCLDEKDKKEKKLQKEKEKMLADLKQGVSA